MNAFPIHVTPMQNVKIVLVYIHASAKKDLLAMEFTVKVFIMFSIITVTDNL